MKIPQICKEILCSDETNMAKMPCQNAWIKWLIDIKCKELFHYEIVVGNASSICHDDDVWKFNS